MAKMPFSLVSNFAVSTGTRFSCNSRPHRRRAELHGSPNGIMISAGCSKVTVGAFTVTALVTILAVQFSHLTEQS